MIPDQRIWQAILINQIIDACREAETPDRQSARAWLMLHNTDRNLVCQFAGIEQEYFDRMIRQIKAKGWVKPDVFKSHAASGRAAYVNGFRYR